MLTKTVNLVKNSWSGWSKKKKLILAIPIILLIILLCVLFFWDTEDKKDNTSEFLENELDKQYKDKLKEQDTKLKKLEEEYKELTDKQKEVIANREKSEKKWNETIKKIDNANTLDELRDLHKQLLR